MTRGELSFRCPKCRGPVELLPNNPAQGVSRTEAGYRCHLCCRIYPIVAGIADFRLRPDPWLGIEEDHAKGLRLASRSELSWRQLVEYYWELTTDTPPEMAHRFAQHAWSGEARGHDLLDDLGTEVPNTPQEGSLLELGCRSGGLLVAAARRGHRVVGIDVAFRWLVIARRQLEENGLEAILCCCNAEALPFDDHQVDAVVAENVFEHVERVDHLLAEAHRLLVPSGVLYATTWNRTSLAPEPHVRLWGVGFLPRPLARRYVAWRRGVTYDRVFLRSARSLRYLLRISPFAQGALAPAPIGHRRLRGLGTFGRSLATLHDSVREWPGMRQALLSIGPILRVLCRRETPQR